MKKFYSLILLLIGLFCCADDESGNYVTSWILSGYAEVQGDNGYNIKIAAFYSFDGDDFEYVPEDAVIVSNVVLIGDGGPFSLSINASALNPVIFDPIDIGMWLDLDDDNLFDTGEAHIIAGVQSGCAVFDPYDPYASFDFVTGLASYGTPDGWYYTEDNRVTGDLYGALLTDNGQF